MRLEIKRKIMNLVRLCVMNLNGTFYSQTLKYLYKVRSKLVEEKQPIKSNYMQSCNVLQPCTSVVATSRYDSITEFSLRNLNRYHIIFIGSLQNISYHHHHHHHLPADVYI